MIVYSILNIAIYVLFLEWPERHVFAQPTEQLLRRSLSKVTNSKTDTKAEKDNKSSDIEENLAHGNSNEINPNLQPIFSVHNDVVTYDELSIAVKGKHKQHIKESIREESRDTTLDGKGKRTSINVNGDDGDGNGFKFLDIFNLLPDPVTPTPAPIEWPTTSSTLAPAKWPTLSPAKTPKITASPIEAPTILPKASPTQNPNIYGPPEPDCDPSLSFIIFSGHDMVCSMYTSAVNITWSPAFVYDSASERFLWCGQYTYDVIIARGKMDFKALKLSNKELVNMANNNSGITVYTTQKLGVYVTDFVAGATYTVLILARTDLGHQSFNRNSALVEMAVADPLLKPGYTRTIALSDPVNAGGTWGAEFDRDESTVTFTGSFPDDIEDIKKDDFVYVIGSDGTSQLTKAQERLSTPQTGWVKWKYVPVDVEDIFTDLDLSADINDKWGDLDSIDDSIDLDVEDDQALDSQMDALPDPVKVAFCMITFGIEDISCFDDNAERRVMFKEGENNFSRQLRFARRLRNAIRKVIDVAVQVVKEIAKVAVEVVNKVNSVLDFIEATMDQTFTFLDIDKAAKLDCAVESVDQTSSGAFELGVGFDFSARAQVKITVGVVIFGSPLKKASLRVFGGIGTKAYALLGASASRTFAPDPIRLFRLSNTFTVFAGPVPIVITNQPTLKAFIAVSASVEAEAFALAQFGFDYSMLFEFDSALSPPFKRPTTSFVQRPPFEEDPEFSLRLRAEAEIGVTLEWNVLFFGLLQATVAADAGVNPRIAVGSDLEAIALTPPFFYTLDDFAIDFFFRVRVSLGINNDLADLFESISGNRNEPACRFQLDRFQLPEPKRLKNATAIPGPLEQAFKAATERNDLVNLTDISLKSLEELGILDDPYSDFIEDIVTTNPFGVNFIVFERSLQLLGIPLITPVAGRVAICEGDDAIALKVETKLDKSFQAVLDGLRDGRWFSNFDGKILSETTEWLLQDNPTNTNAVSMRLPRSSTQRFYSIDDDASVILRATPEIFPFPPKSQFSKAELKKLFPNVKDFECCLDEDCNNKRLPFDLADGERRFCNNDKICSKRLF